MSDNVPSLENYFEQVTFFQKKINVLSFLVALNCPMLQHCTMLQTKKILVYDRIVSISKLIECFAFLCFMQ
jgi:hypothetical protein